MTGKILTVHNSAAEPHVTTLEQPVAMLMNMIVLFF